MLNIVDIQIDYRLSRG